MKKKIHLCFIAGVMALLLIGITMAIVPPPPANQDLGIYDTVFDEFTEEKCRECHSSGLPDRHHMLVFHEEYVCTDCHPPDHGSGNPVTVIRDCLNSSCHTGTPHHETTAAIERHCSVCHGTFVDDYDDGHYIPDYAVSNVTPATGYRYINETTDKKWGGCEACHEPDYTADPVIETNAMTHHTAVFSMTCGIDNNICHFDPVTDIRKCEDCHGVKSLHNIQYDYENTSGYLGYGHIGDGYWDCLGCHAWFVPTKSSAHTDNINPDINNLSKGSVEAGMPTNVSIIGSNFVNFVNGNTYTSEVIITNGVEKITLEPDNISSSQIDVSIPPLDNGSYGLYVLKGDKRSKMLPFMVERSVNIQSAFIEGDKLIIIGSGFNEEPEEEFKELLNVTIKDGNNDIISTVTSWDNTEITLDCEYVSIGNMVTVNALFGSDSTEIKGLQIDLNPILNPIPNPISIRMK